MTMKNAIIVHGTGGNPNSFWFPSIKEFLENKGYAVWVPQLPKADKPNLKIQLPFLLSGKFNSETILIGHSAGCPLILSFLENIQVKIYKVILVAGFCRPTGKDKQQDILLLQKKYNWKKIKNNASNIIYINSADDPWGCNDREGYYMFKKTGGDLIIKKSEGHFGSDVFNQPYKTFPLLEKLLELE